MIQLTHGIDTSAILDWLEDKVRPKLTPDVSNYAKGRLRAWLGIEPSLGPNQSFRKGISIPLLYLIRLKEIVSFNFDYCLVTYSGEDKPIGITPHRDSSFADYEAVGLNVSGTCKFSYWNDRDSFGLSKSTGRFPFPGNPSHVISLIPGDLIRFNCKNVHSAEPSPNRWNMNFWRKK